MEARKLLDAPQYNGAFAHVIVTFSGQEATLTGAVAREEEKNLLESMVRDRVRLRDEQPDRNPVIAVHNRVEVNADAAPHRHHEWLLLVVYGSQKRIEGVLKSPSQRLAILEKVEKAWPAQDETSRERTNQIIVDEKAWPASDWEKTLAHMPDIAALAGKNDKRSLVAITTGDGLWRTFSPSATNAEIAAALASARVSEREVNIALTDFRIHQSAPVTPETSH